MRMKRKIKTWFDKNIEKRFKVPWTFVLLGFIFYLLFLIIFLLIFLKLIPSLSGSPTATYAPSILNPVIVLVNGQPSTGNSKTFILSLMTSTMTFMGGLIGLFYLGVKVQERFEHFNEKEYKTRNDTNNEIISALKILQEDDVTSKLFAVKTLFDIIKFRQSKRTTQDIVNLLTSWLRHEGDLHTRVGRLNEIELVHGSPLNRNNFEVDTSYQNGLKYSKVRENIFSELTELLDLENPEFGGKQHRDNLKIYLNRITFNEDFTIMNAKLDSLMAEDCRFTKDGYLSLMDVEVENEVKVTANHVGDFQSSISVFRCKFNCEAGNVFIGYKDSEGYAKPNIQVDEEMKSELIMWR